MQSELSEFSCDNLPSNWTCKRLLECTEDENISYGIVQPGQNDTSGIPIIRVNNFSNGSLDLSTVLRVSPEIEKKYARTRLSGGEVLLTLVGSTGQSIIAPPALAGWNVPRAIAVIRPSKEIGADWLHICLQSQEAQHFLDVRANTTVQKTLNLKDVRDIPIPIPPKPIKSFIESVSTSLSNKIELNRQMNATLEAMAQALFKSWFVDFDPVLDNALAAGNPIPDELQEKAAAREALGDARKPLPEDIAALFPAAFVWTEEMGWIPEGWEVSQLGKFVDVKRGGSPRPIHDYLVPDGLPWVKISDATACEFRFLGGTKEFIKPEGLKKTVLLKSGSLILSNSATPGLPLFLDLDACIHDGWLYFPKKKKFSDLYLYQLFLVIRQELIQQGNGSVFTNLKTDILKNHSLIVPIQNLLDKFDLEVLAMSQRIHSLHIENKALTQLRDALLPKLLSGELRIPDAEKLVEEIQS